MTRMVSPASAAEKPAALESVDARVMVWLNTPTFAVERSMASGVVPPAPSVPNAPIPVSVKAASPLALSAPDSQSAGAPPNAALAMASAATASPVPSAKAPRLRV